MCMGSSPAPPNEARFSPASGARVRASLMTSLSTRRSMRSPHILKRPSTSTGFLRLRDNKRHQGQSRPMDAAGKSIERERAPNVFGGSLFARADPGIVDLDFAIDARAPEPQAERARECRLGPAGIGGRVSAPVAPHGAPRGPGRSFWGEPSRDNDQTGRQPRGTKIDKIVEFRRGEAESRMALRAVTKHAVGGVDRFVASAARKPAERQPESGRDDGVGKILGEALDRGTGDTSLVKFRDVAADDFCRRRPARPQSAGKSLRDGKDVGIKAALRDETRSDKRAERYARRLRKFQTREPEAEKIGAAAGNR